MSYVDGQVGTWPKEKRSVVLQAGCKILGFGYEWW